MQLKLLWDMQELDLAISAYKTKIEEAPGLSGVDEAKEELKELEVKLSAQEENLRNDQKHLRQLEMRTQKIVDDRKELSDNMYGGKITNVKELEQMHRRMDQLAEEKKKLEEEIINLMESIEEQEEMMKETGLAISKKKEELEEKEKRLQADLARFNKELSHLENERVTQAEKIEPKYMERYIVLAEKHQGRPLSKVENDICGACRVFISSAQRGHLYNPGALVYCENCGRLLVRFDDRQAEA